MKKVDIILRIVQDIIILTTMILSVLGVMSFEEVLIIFAFFGTFAVLNIQRNQENEEARIRTLAAAVAARSRSTQAPAFF